MIKFLSILNSLLIVIGLTLEGIPYLFRPTVKFDMTACEKEISTRACGYLYGLAEEDVPSKEVVKSLNISSDSQKVYKGLQHPTGDVDNVSGNLDSCDYIVVYLQDCYSTWYYCYDEIEAMRKAGTYDCDSFVETSFLPQVTEKVTEISKKSYSDKIVYCPYNECDNAVWFGTQKDDGGCEFDDTAKQKFYNAWKITYDLIKSINPDALIGGPGYFDYNIEKLSGFLTYCKNNNCLPDIMIYHELNETSSLFWEDHVTEYREYEKKLAINEIPVIVTEYGCMYECGVPSYMLHYIKAIENSGVYGNVAYWRLSNNLCDTCTRANIPNSNWWLYKWYCDMNGLVMPSKTIDIAHSDFENTIKYARKKFHYSQMDAFGSYDEESKTATIICGGCNYDFQLLLSGAKKKWGNESLRVKIESVTFEGLSGEVLSPVTIGEYYAKAEKNLKIKMTNPEKNTVYRVTIAPDDGSPIAKCVHISDRYEAEHGTLLGKAYTYNSAYGTTGEEDGMCGGFENAGDGITIDFEARLSGNYTLALIYGNSNDGSKPSDRKDTTAKLIIDGKESITAFPNTIKSEYTDKLVINTYLEQGRHSLTLMHDEGTFVIDSMLVALDEPHDIYNQYEKQYGEYLVIAPHDGYYSISTDSSVRYLKKGLNYIKAGNGEKLSVTESESRDYISVDFGDIELSDGAEITVAGGRKCIGGISSEGGNAKLRVNVQKSGTYALTLTYSNNEEGGLHAYNVDLIEEYITINAGGKEYTVWCVNTFSNCNFNTAVAYIELEEGENEITLSNNGYVTFASRPATSPFISAVTVNPYIK